MKKYRINLIDGTVLVGERPWYYSLVETSSLLQFRNVTTAYHTTQPGVMHSAHKMCIPKTSILFIQEIQEEEVKT